MWLRAFLTFLLAFFLCWMDLGPAPRVLAQEKVYTLEESINEALEKNWALRAKKQRLDQADYVKKQARSEFLPKLSTSYGYVRYGQPRIMKASIPGFGDREIEIASQDNYQWAGTVSQPIFTGFALLSSYKLAELGIDQSQLEVELQRLDLTLQVKRAYFGVLESDKALEVAEQAVASLKSHVAVARSFYQVGMIPINDLLKAEVELSNARHDLIKARNATRLARCSFNRVLSRPTNAPVDVEDILVFHPQPVEFEACLKMALENRPEIKLLALNIAQVDQEIRLVKSENYPEVALTYDYIKEGDTLRVDGSEFHEANRWQVGVGLTWTFWEWGKTRYGVREKESLKEELLQTRRSIEDDIGFEVKDAILGLEEAEKNIPATKKAVEQAEENLRVSEERYKAQVTTSTEVLDAQTLLTQARSNYYTALYDHNLAKARLKRAYGAY